MTYSDILIEYKLGCLFSIAQHMNKYLELNRAQMTIDLKKGYKTDFSTIGHVQRFLNSIRNFYSETDSFFDKYGNKVAYGVESDIQTWTIETIPLNISLDITHNTSQRDNTVHLDRQFTIKDFCDAFFRLEIDESIHCSVSYSDEKVLVHVTSTYCKEWKKDEICFSI